MNLKHTNSLTSAFHWLKRYVYLLKISQTLFPSIQRCFGTSLQTDPGGPWSLSYNTSVALRAKFITSIQLRGKTCAGGEPLRYTELASTCRDAAREHPLEWLSRSLRVPSHEGVPYIFSADDRDPRPTRYRVALLEPFTYFRVF